MKKLKILESWVEQFEEAEELYGEVEVLSEFISLGEATEEDVNKAYIKIQKKLHPDVSPETSRLSSLVNEAKEIVLRDLG